MRWAHRQPAESALKSRETRVGEDSTWGEGTEAGPGWARCGPGVAWAASGPLAQQAERHLLGQAVAEGRPSVRSMGVPAVSAPRVLASPFQRQCQCLACGCRMSSPGQEGSKKAAMSQEGPGP